MTSTSFEVGQNLGSGLTDRLRIFVFKSSAVFFRFKFAALCLLVSTNTFSETLPLPGVHEASQDIQLAVIDVTEERGRTFHLALEHRLDLVPDRVEVFDSFVVPPKLITEQTTDDSNEGAPDHRGGVAVQEVYEEGHSKFLSFVVCSFVYAAFYLPFVLVGIWSGQVIARRADFRDNKAKYIKFRRMLRDKNLPSQRRKNLEWCARHYLNCMKRGLRNGK